MLSFVRKVGANFGIIDDVDGVLDWVGQDVVDEAISKGVYIRGISDVPVPKAMKATIPCNICNWNDGKNIFTSYTSAMASSKEFKITAGKKTYKGKYAVIGNGMVSMSFNFGVDTQVEEGVFRRIFKK